MCDSTFEKYIHTYIERGKYNIRFTVLIKHQLHSAYVPLFTPVLIL